MKATREGIIKSLGPGIVLAGACIGGSHLMSSTTAGAKFGFALVGLILLTNLFKYPFVNYINSLSMIFNVKHFI